MTNTTNNTIFAQALIDNMDYKSMRINGEAVGVANARKWTNAVKALRLPAYAIRAYRYNHMGDAEAIKACKQDNLYEAIRALLDLIGEVNGAKLNAKNLAEEIIAHAMKETVIDISVEMAHARNQKKLAKKAMTENETEETIANYDLWTETVKTLEAQPGNCKKVTAIVSETAFVKSVEFLVGSAITKQMAKSAEEIAAEEEARRQARRAKTKAKKAEKAKAEMAA